MDQEVLKCSFQDLTLTKKFKEQPQIQVFRWTSILPLDCAAIFA